MYRLMYKAFHKSKNKKEAEDWDILQQISMTSQERLAIADELKKRVYGTDAPDVRDARCYDR